MIILFDILDLSIGVIHTYGFYILDRNTRQVCMDRSIELGILLHQIQCISEVNRVSQIHSKLINELQFIDGFINEVVKSNEIDIDSMLLDKHVEVIFNVLLGDCSRINQMLNSNRFANIDGESPKDQIEPGICESESHKVSIC